MIETTKEQLAAGGLDFFQFIENPSQEFERRAQEIAASQFYLIRFNHNPDDAIHAANVFLLNTIFQIWGEGFFEDLTENKISVDGRPLTEYASTTEFRAYLQEKAYKKWCEAEDAAEVAKNEYLKLIANEYVLS